MQSVLITNNVVSWNLAHGEGYSIQHYVIEYLSNLREVGGFLRVSSINKTNHRDITEILLKVALSTLTLNSIKEVLRKYYVYFLSIGVLQ